jgi:hypothetical protein
VYFAGGDVLVLVAAFGFFVSLKTPTGMVQLHLRSTVPMIMAVGLFATAYTLARSPRAVGFSADGLHVYYRRGAKLLGWGEIAWAEVGSQAMTNRKLLTVYGNNGKALLKLPASLEGFDSLAAGVRQRLAEHPSPYAGALRWRKCRRQAVGLLVGSVLTLAGGAWMGWMAYDERRSAELMRTQGAQGEAVVVRKFVAPDGRTHRIEYRVADAGEGAPLHNVEVDPLVWSILRTGQRVPVKTVPGRPEIARLVVGEVEDAMEPSPMTKLLLMAGMLVLTVVFLVGAILGFRGIEIDWDAESNKFKITRLTRPGGLTGGLVS